MQEAIRLSKKAFTWGVVATTIAWSVGVAALPLSTKAVTLGAGTLIKASLPAVYYYAGNGKRYVFPNEKTYKTWYTDFSSVQVITDADLAAVPIGGNVTYRPGTKLVKIQTDPKTYAVEPGGSLRWVQSEAIAVALYGTGWAGWIEDVSDAFFTNYTSGADITSNAYAKGTLVKDSAGVTWYIDGTSKRMVTTAGFTANRFNMAYVVTGGSVNLSGLTMGSDISTNEPALTDVAQLGLSSTPAPGPVASSVSVSAASDTPASATIVTDTVDGAQALIGMLKLRFTASADGAVQVNSLKLSRGGISSDADIQDVYLYEGDGYSKQLAKSSSIASGKVNFLNAGGLFTVAAGTTKDIMVRIDLGTNVTAGKTVSLSLAGADVVTATSGTSVSGSANGNIMTVASVTDLGQLEMVNITPTAATTVDPQDNFELWRFRFDANDQDMLIKWVKVTNAGSVDGDDLQNFKLMDGATQLGATIPTMSSNVLMFDLSGLTGGGYKITSGQTKQLALSADMKGGTNRTFRFSIRESTDVLAWDLNYNVATRPVADGSESFSVVEAGGATTISTGRLVIQKASDSPSTNVADGATNVLLAKFNFTASGEDVKVNSLVANCSMNTSTDDLDNIKLLFDGAQVGTTDATANCDGAEDMSFTFGNSFIVPAGSTKTLEVKADLTDTTVGANDTILINLETGSSNAEGRVSLTSISTSSASANTVTVKTGAVTVTEDASFTDRTATNPTGVLGATGVLIGQFIVTGGGEDSDITQVVLQDANAGGNTLADTFQNLKLFEGSNQVGQTFGTLTDTASTTYTFTPGTAIRVTAGGTKVFMIKADIRTGGTVFTADGAIGVDSVVSTGVSTGTTTSVTGDPIAELQNGHILANGSLSVFPDSATPIRQTFVLGSTSQELGRFVLKAGVEEDVNITKFVVSDIMTGGGVTAATGTLKNLKLVDATTGTQYGGTIASLNSSATGSTFAPVAIFDNIPNLTVGKSTQKAIKVIADLTGLDDSLTSSSHRLAIIPCFVCAGNLGDSGTNALTNLSIVATGKDSGFSISGSSLDFNTSSANSNTDANVLANVHDMYRTKITIAKASDAPSGSSTPGDDQIVAKFVVTNSANVGTYDATLELMNLAIDSNVSGTTSTREIKVFRDTTATANQLATTNANEGTTTLDDTTYAEASFTDTDIAAGSSRTFIVTMDTQDATTNENITVGLGLGDIQWSDGSTNGGNITVVDSLPVVGNTLTY